MGRKQSSQANRCSKKKTRTTTTKKSNRQFLYESMQRRPARTYLEKGRKHQASCAPSFWELSFISAVSWDEDWDWRREEGELAYSQQHWKELVSKCGASGAQAIEWVKYITALSEVEVLPASSLDPANRRLGWSEPSTCNQRLPVKNNLLIDPSEDQKFLLGSLSAC